MPDGPFERGKAILADELNRVARDASHASRLPSAPGGGAGAPQYPAQPMVQVIVIARTINEPAPIVDHGYTVRSPLSGDTWEITGNQLIVRASYNLIHEGASSQLMRWDPAPVINSPEWTEYPWMSNGNLYVSPRVDASGKRSAMVDLFGIAPHRGC